MYHFIGIIVETTHTKAICAKVALKGGWYLNNEQCLCVANITMTTSVLIS